MHELVCKHIKLHYLWYQ